MRYVIGTRSFDSKAAAIEEVRAILHGAEPEVRLTGENAVLLKALFSQHPRGHEKANRGVSGFMVGLNDYHGARTRGFYVIHDDGSATAFSYRPCFDAKSAEPSAIGAMRAAIMLGQRQIAVQAFLRRDTALCPICQRTMRRQNAQVHHLEPKFRDIAKAYIERFGEPEVVPSNGLGDMFVRTEDRERWVAFHDRLARRIVVCATCNLADESKAAKPALETTGG